MLTVAHEESDMGKHFLFITTLSEIGLAQNIINACEEASTLFECQKESGLKSQMLLKKAKIKSAVAKKLEEFIKP